MIIWGKIGLIMGTKNYLAFDLGAESGRAVLGTITDGGLAMSEIRRFPNGPVDREGRLRWDVFRLLTEMRAAIEDCARLGVRPASLAVDTWGVDFGLLRADGTLAGLPFAYRDPGLLGAMEETFRFVPRDRIYELTGLQFLPFNSLFQLRAMARDASSPLGAASDLLFMPDLLNYLLTGVKASEYTIASTSQCLNPRTRSWEFGLIEAVGAPPRIFRNLVEPGTPLGLVAGDPGKEPGAGLQVVTTASHDTAAAVAAVPAEGDDWAYISSGTWSLVGVETSEPVITPESRDSNFTNEGGVGGRVRFLKNVAGLWLLQQCRRSWAGEREWTYAELTEKAASCRPFQAPLVDPDSLDFLNPPDMPAAIAGYCRRTGQNPPESVALFSRCILESLALKYRRVLEDLERIRRRPVRAIHIIGGGSRNALLCRLTADATGLPVVAGPAEASAAGNILVQAMAARDLAGLDGIRAVARRSFDLAFYEPRPSNGWDDAYVRFNAVLSA
jgi:rhamnulokinase